MTINSIKTAKVFACPGTYAYVAEAEIEEDQKFLYVSIQMYDGEQCAVTEESMFAFIAEGKADPAEHFIEEYDDLKAAKEESKYRDVFAKLVKAIEFLG